MPDKQDGIRKKKKYKGRLQNQKKVKLGTLSQQEGGRSEGLSKCPNPYFEPKIEHKFVHIGREGGLGGWDNVPSFTDFQFGNLP